MNINQIVELLTGPLLIFTILYAILSFLVPFAVFFINSKVDEVNLRVTELQNETAKIEELLVLMAQQNNRPNQPINSNNQVPH